jgi:hypothetical protein
MNPLDFSGYSANIGINPTVPDWTSAKPKFSGPNTPRMIIGGDGVVE